MRQRSEKEHRKHRSNTVLCSRASRRLRNNQSETTCTCKMRNVNCCWNVTSNGMRFHSPQKLKFQHHVSLQSSVDFLTDDLFEALPLLLRSEMCCFVAISASVQRHLLLSGRHLVHIIMWNPPRRTSVKTL